MGFNITKFDIEKKDVSIKEGLSISTNLDISEIKEANTKEIKTEDSILIAKFKYIVNYDPEIAKIELGGNIIVGIDKELSKTILKQWKDKKIPEEFQIPLFNIILRKANIKALQFEEELGLPSHFPLPSLRKEEKE